MDRRAFLSSAAALAAWNRLGRSASPKFGCAAITWGGNDAAAIEDIAATGYRGIQLRASAVTTWANRPAALKELLATRGLTFVALSSGVLNIAPAMEAENLAMHVRHAQFAREAGCLYLQVVDERPRGRAPSPEDFAGWVDY